MTDLQPDFDVDILVVGGGTAGHGWAISTLLDEGNPKSFPAANPVSTKAHWIERRPIFDLPLFALQRSRQPGKTEF
jgi:hypothetical protein